MGLLKVIEWKDDTHDTLVHKIDLKKDYITRGSTLTVRESQAAVFCDKGRMADVFLPGYYKLSTDNVPILTRLMSWKYGFESPFKSDVYFVNTKQFTGCKWGTSNPIIIRDADYGAVRVRAFGSYSFKVDDPFVFLTELSGTNSSFKTEDINEWLRSMVVTRVSDIVGESKIPVLDMAGNLVEFGEIVQKQLGEAFKEIGLQLIRFNFENFSMPEALEKALDESASLGILGKNMNIYMAKAQADALKEAAKNPGSGNTMGAGMGVGMGMSMGAMFGNMYNNAYNNMNNMNNGNGGQAQAQQPVAPVPPAANVTFKCTGCGTALTAGVKFCPECGKQVVTKCPKCGNEVKPGTKFCSECGEKL